MFPHLLMDYGSSLSSIPTDCWSIPRFVGESRCWICDSQSVDRNIGQKLIILQAGFNLKFRKVEVLMVAAGDGVWASLSHAYLYHPVKVPPSAITLKLSHKIANCLANLLNWGKTRSKKKLSLAVLLTGRWWFNSFHFNDNLNSKRRWWRYWLR